MRKIDYSIYYVTDDELLHENYDLYKSVEHAIIGGATVIQLREKKTNTRDFLQKAVKLKEICDRYDIPLIINDRIDIALAIGCVGVHLGQDDMPISIARKILGDEKIIGISTGSVSESIDAMRDGADYIGVGAMYSTNTKTDANITTIDELKNIRQQVSIPIVVIGGINEKTIPDFKDIYIDGLAVVSAISLSSNHIDATRNLKQLFYKNTKIKSAIFDIDGTLTQTIGIWDEVIEKLQQKRGFRYTDSDLKMLWNMGFDKTAEYTVKKFSLDITRERFFEDIKEISIKEYEKADLVLNKGVKEILEKMKKNGIKLAVCTSLSKTQYEIVLKKVGIIDYFDVIMSSQDEKIEKSDSKIYAKIAEKTGVSARNTIVFDDDKNSAYGVKNAGMRMCLISSDKYDVDEYTRSYIDYEVADFTYLDFL